MNDVVASGHMLSQIKVMSEELEWFAGGKRVIDAANEFSRRCIEAMCFDHVFGDRAKYGKVIIEVVAT